MCPGSVNADLLPDGFGDLKSTLDEGAWKFYSPTIIGTRSVRLTNPVAAIRHFPGVVFLPPCIAPLLQTSNLQRALPGANLFSTDGGQTPA